MSRTRRATYRLQLRPGFGFAEAAGLADYLAALGVSHVYLSPCFEAEPGSTHGYDVADPGRVRAELGGETGWRRMIAAFEERGLGRLLDVVPNHMSIGSTANSWWWDVLENGLASHYASTFDVDWAPSSPAENRIVLPILGDHYGGMLAAGGIRLERRGGQFVITVHDRALPAAPRALDDVLRHAAADSSSDELAFYADALGGLPLSTSSDRASTFRRHRDKSVIAGLLDRLFTARPEVAQTVDATVAALNADVAALDAFLERQNFRLVHWTGAASDLGYRRFFDVHTLVGLRVEDPAVFADTQRLALAWLADGTVDGLRIDHPDGLRDPLGYLLGLRAAAPGAWLVVEKILAPGETLPRSFPVEGTTGYDFLNLVQGVLLNPAGAAPLQRLAEDFTGESQDFGALADGARKEILADTLGSELARLTELAARAVGALPEGRDFTRRELGAALTEILVAFPVYRGYVRAGAPVSDEDRALLARVIARATERRPDLKEVFALLEPVLCLERGAGGDLVERLQQTAAAVMAKGVEDTAFYRHLRLLALNEVGGAPERFGVSVEEFHQALAAGAPGSLLATSTHDTKRSEDVRARLVVLSQIPEEWAAFVRALAALRPAPDRHAAYAIYQTLVGAWPIDAERLVPVIEKSIREAKRRTSWTRQERAYEDAVRGYLRDSLDDPEFTAVVERFVARILPAARRNSLAQTLVKLTAPGVPDIYQGCELWDLGLVDPDNRRPVDFAARRRLLDSLDGMGVEDVLARMDEGLPKLFVIREALRLRERRPAPFAGDCRPLTVMGNAIGYVRGGAIAVIVPRLDGQAQVTLPDGRWRNVLTRQLAASGSLDPFADFPVALYESQS